MTNIVSDAQWRAALNAVGAEDFDTGHAEYLRGKLVEEYISVDAGVIAVEDGTKALRVVTSDVALHNLVRESPIRRVADSYKYAVKRLEKGTGGTTVIVLRE